MTDETRAPRLERARFTTYCRGRAEPIRAGEPALRRPRTGALTCAACARAEVDPQADARERPKAA